MEDSLLHIFGGAKKRDLTNFNRVEKEEKRKYETASDEISAKLKIQWTRSRRRSGGKVLEEEEKNSAKFSAGVSTDGFRIVRKGWVGKSS